jgi:hypothetical protein
MPVFSYEQKFARRDAMHAIIDEFKTTSYLFTTEYDSGGGYGAEITTYVTLLNNQEPILCRTFYFENEIEHVRSFAKKFVRDPDYRQKCLAGTVHWKRTSKWYDRNAEVYCPQFQTIQAASTKEQRRKMNEQNRWTEIKLKQLFRVIDKQVDTLENTKEYREHQLTDQNFIPSRTIIDPEIREIVRRFNLLPSVKTKFSCQGIRGGIYVEGWKYGPIWFPGNHAPLAHIIFEKIPTQLAERLAAHLQNLGIGGFQWDRVTSNLPQNNAQFLAALEEFVRHSE